MKILITGGLGYIGKHTITLLQNFLEIHVIDVISDRETETNLQTLCTPKIVFHKCCYGSDTAREIIAHNKFEACIHFGAFKSIKESIENPLMYYQNNLSKSLHLFQYLIENGCKCILFSSSATVYGSHSSLKTSEKTLSGVGITNPYGRTKYFTEEILYDLSIAYPKISFICLRYFNPIGVHHSGLLKENIMKASNVMPSILRVILGKETVFKIFGDDYDTHDGSALRDYVHVMDIADGHLKALEVKHNVAGLHVYNVGNGKGYSVKELLKEMETVYGKKIPYTVEKRRPGDLGAVSADETKAQTELKWIPKYTLHDMCKSVIDAYC